MRLLSFRNPVGERRIGALTPTGERIVDLHHAYAEYARSTLGEPRPEALAEARLPVDMRQLFEGGDLSLYAAQAALDHAQSLPVGARGATGHILSFSVESVEWLAPIKPTKLVHTAGNFKEHADELEAANFATIKPWIMFFQNVDAIIGPGEPIIHPQHLTSELDYELELAVVLKKGGRYWTPEQAADAIGGYVIFNDVTARDLQRREMQSKVFSYCKAFETFCPLGPCIVTPDEIPDAHNLEMRLRVNGELRQSSNTNRMSVSIPEIVSHYSAIGYSPGDVVTTGTVSGVAALSADPEAWYLRPGDVVECEIEHIGVLRNPVVAWSAVYDGNTTPTLEEVVLS